VLPAANAELRYALALRQFTNRTAADLARGGFAVVDAQAKLSEVAEQSVVRPELDFLISDRGRVVGYLSAARLWSNVRSDRPGTLPVLGLAQPLADPIPAKTPIEDAVGGFRDGGPDVAPVIDDDGTLIGVVRLGDLTRAVQLARRAQSR